MTVALLGTLAGMADAVTRVPQILAISWGRMEAEGLGVGRDFKLYPGGGPGEGYYGCRDRGFARVGLAL